MNTSLKTTTFQLGNKSHAWGTTEKKNIVLHGSFSRTKYSFTASQNSETHLMEKWNITGDKCAGHYVVGRSGEIYSCIEEDRWSSHLGPEKFLTDLNKRSISVFLCNELFIEKENGKNYAFGYPHPSNMYKGKVFPFPFKGYTLWADYDKEQIDATIALLLDIIKRWNLPPTMLTNTTKFNPQSVNSATIVSAGNLAKNNYSLPLPAWVLDSLKDSGLEMIK